MSEAGSDKNLRARKQPRTRAEADAAGLRQDAEARAGREPLPAPRDATQMQRLVHELHVHQIELEMQNEALRAAQAAIEDDLACFTELCVLGPVGYFALSRDGTIQRTNFAGAGLLGLSGPANLSGQHLGAYVSAESLPAFNRLLEKAFADGGRQYCELSFTPTGKTASVTVRIEALVNAVTQTCHVAGINVSEQKRSELALRASEAFNVAVLNSLREHIAVLDAQGRIVTVNAAWAQFAAENGAPELAADSIGMNYRDVCRNAAERSAGAYASAAWAGIDAVLSGIRQKFTMEYPCDAPEVQRYFRMTVYPLAAPRGGAVVSHEDITTSRQAAEAMRHARLEAERANNAKSRFLAAASHDLRQPLAALSLYVDTLGLKPVSPDTRLLRNMKDCVSSLSELLNDLLDLSKLEAGVVRPQPGGFSLDDIIKRVLAVHGQEAQAKKLRLRYRPTSQIVYCDPVLLQRMLGNLVANAIRYTEHGGVLLASRWRRGKLWIEVWDTGVGIPAEMTTEIFEEFKQLAPSKGRRGSGLGLAIVARTAALLDTELRVRSVPGKGCVFAIELHPGRRDETMAPPRFPHRALRIGLVEDNPQLLDALEYALRADGHEVIAANVGAALLARLGNVPPDIIISDYRFDSGQTGLDVIADAKTLFGEALPAIVITGDTDPGLIRVLADAGIAVQYKPIDFDALQRRIAELTDRRAR